MDITMITKLVTIVLAISLASERLVTFLKTLFPALASKTNDTGSAVPPPVTGPEQKRQLLVMAIAFLAAWLSASFINGGKWDPTGTYDIGPPKTDVPIWLIGLLASGGSAFWTNLLGYVQAVKNTTTQQFLQQKQANNAQLTANPPAGNTK